MQIRSMFASAALVLGLVAVAPSAAHAQMGFVVQGSYGFDIEEIGIGAGVNMGLGSLTANQGIRLETTFDYFLVESPLTYWEINGNLLKDIPSVSGLYVGAGVNYRRLSLDCGTGCGGFDISSSDIGINVLSGLKFGTGKAAPFVQARFALGGGEQLYVTGGFRF